MDSETPPTGLGTVRDLIADAEAAGLSGVTPRLITDWVERGLVDRPRRRKSGQRGQDLAVYSAQQRRLFTLLLEKRQQTSKIPVLAQIPVYIWLFWDDIVPTRQARRALGTFAGQYPLNQRATRRGVGDLLEQLAHPGAPRSARGIFLRAVSEAALTGRIEPERVESAVTGVFEPSPAWPGQPRLLRAVGHPQAPLTSRSAVDVVQARLLAWQQLREDRVSEVLLEQARGFYRRDYAEYLAQLPGFRAYATGAAREMYELPSLEDEVLGSTHRFLTLLGFLLRACGKRPAVS